MHKTDGETDRQTDGRVQHLLRPARETGFNSSVVFYNFRSHHFFRNVMTYKESHLYIVSWLNGRMICSNPFLLQVLSCCMRTKKYGISLYTVVERCVADLWFHSLS